MVDTLFAEQLLVPGQSIDSNNGFFSLIFQTDGNLVLRKTALGWTKPVWSSGTNNQGATVCVMQGDGNLVIYAGATALWSTGTHKHGGSRLVIQDDGNAVVYTPGNQAIWASGTVSAVPPTGPSAAGSMVFPGQTLAVGQPLFSDNGRFALILQGDGNLVLYRTYPNHPSVALWASDTAGKKVASCILQGDGNLVIYNMDAVPMWSSGSFGHPGASLVVQDDGNAVIYAPGNVAVWATGTVSALLPTGPSANGNSMMNPGEVLLPGESISSPATGQFMMAFQTDGNLVWYNMNAGPAAVWASGTDGTLADVCIMQTDGNLVVYDLNAQPLWASATDGHPQSFLVAQDDGNAVIYDPANVAQWSVRTEKEDEGGFWGWLKEAWNTVVGGIADFFGLVISLLMSIPVIGAMFRTVWNWVVEVVMRIVGGIDWIASLFGIRPSKRMAFRVIIPTVNGSPIATPAQLQNMVDGAIATYKRVLNIELEFRGFFTHREEPPDVAMRPICGVNGFFADWVGDWGLVGTYYETATTSTGYDGAWRKVIGYGSELIVFVVIDVGEDTARRLVRGCSFSATHDYVFVEADGGPQLIAHEVAHACGLWHTNTTNNLMVEGNIVPVPTLNRWQISAVRGSRHCTYF